MTRREYFQIKTEIKQNYALDINVLAVGFWSLSTIILAVLFVLVNSLGFSILYFILCIGSAYLAADIHKKNKKTKERYKNLLSILDIHFKAEGSVEAFLGTTEAQELFFKN